MCITKRLRDARDLIIGRMAWSGTQNFLGARWVGHLVDNSPACIEERVALRFLSLSPHYFYDRDIRAEAERNRKSRQALVDALVRPHLKPAMRVLDYGCGPGYMACAVADYVDHVYALDISRGVLACAKVLNSRPNLSYLGLDEIRQLSEPVDLAYSFAVVQHLTTDVLVAALELLADRIYPGGALLLHFAVPGQGGWRTEAEWVTDKSITGRTKLRYGLNCFGRSVEEMKDLVSKAGFKDVAVRSLDGTLTVPGDDDITKQHWLIALRA